MPRLHYIHRDEALSMLGCMPPERKGETPARFEHRKGLAASQMEADFNLPAYAIPGKRARRYKLSDVVSAQASIKPIAA